MTHIGTLVAALLLDAIFGDPDRIWRRYPHPAAIMGRGVAWLDRRLNRGANKRARGVLATAVLVSAAGVTGVLIARLPDFGILECALAAILLAQKSLVAHITAVARALERGLADGRRAVQMVVGRDADALDRAGIIRGAVESVAENFSDGVVAPAFWFVLFGLPGMMIYKAVNTADSMIGYRSEKYIDFGWAAARLDDLLNWIPARLGGGLICLAFASRRACAVMRRDAPLHRSPNAGWPEAATAAIVGIAISGPRSYDGRITDDPFVNAEGRHDPVPGDIDAAVRVIWRAWAVMVAILVTVWVLQAGG